MKSQGLIKKAIFYIFLLYGLYPISCPGQTRQIETKRLMHYTNNMDFSSHTSVSSSTTNQTYQYCPDNPELI
ncbi:MAG TPA: hypothetical protein PKK33_10260, partial [Candidatus Cloacimonadota bacterium]|nr:hypothetical protein [Candidatus Cloacimonadota bacterium]